MGTSVSTRIELTWPDKGRSPHLTSSGSWSFGESGERGALDLCPLVKTGAVGVQERPSAFVLGDRLAASRTLRKLVGRSARLVYADVPRIEGFDETRAFRGETYKNQGTWLSMLSEHLRGVIRLLREDGVVVLHVGDQEQPYARLICDELLGHHNYLGSFVWQTHYSPKGGKPTKDIGAIHDTLMVYAKNKDQLGPLSLPQPPLDYANRDEDPRGAWIAKQKDAGRDTVRMSYHLPPYRWEIVVGGLPPGLWRLNPFSGVIWGQPAELGTFRVKVRVTDRDGRATEKSLSIQVVEPGDPRAQGSDRVVWWMPGAVADQADDDPPRITGSARRVAEQGRSFSWVLRASGGRPWQGPKRPSRGWAFGEAKLTAAILEDRCHFGKKGDAIPEPKKYLSDLDQGVRRVNLSSWWDSRKAGRSQDATKHLKTLREAGVIEQVVQVPKPEALLGRLVSALSRPGDTVIELFGRGGDLAATALKTGRRFVSLCGGQEQERDDFRSCALPRAGAIVGGLEASLPSGLVVPGRDSVARTLGFVVLEVGEPVAVFDRTLEYPRLHLPVGSADDPGWLASLLAADGFVVTITDQGVLGRSFDGTSLAMVLPPSVFLDSATVSDVVSGLSPDVGNLAIYHFRSTEDVNPRRMDHRVSLRRVPMDMRV